MRFISLSLIVVINLGLSACGGGSSSDTSKDTTKVSDPTDVCLNYPNAQSFDEISSKGFVEDGMGNCFLERNHEALALSGVDVVRIEGWTGKDSPIAVIDSGYRVTHEAIAQQTQVVAAYHDDNANYLMDVGEKEDGVAAELTSAHGTSVASMVVAVASGAALWLKATGDENPLTRDLAIATKDAINSEGIGIINHSNDLFSTGLIYRNANDDETGVLPVLSTSQAIVVAASGNTGLDLSYSLDNAQSVVPTLQSFLELPDEAENVLLVGVYDEAYQDIALYSNTPGHRQEIQARFLVTGGETLSTASSGADSAYRDVSGTSFATPLVSGAIAIVQEANPGLTPVDAANILLETALRPTSLGYGLYCESQTDLGMFSSDCGAMKYGMGIMDLPAAISRAREMGE